jgi:RNA polymerase subunit RPABC4/transcription elongation factor Spt4
MKVRIDFVTNSSSTSFVCEICRHAEEITDWYDTNVILQCKNGHCFCPDHLDKPRLNLAIECISKSLDEGNDGFIADEMCPLCMLEEITNDMVLEYIEGMNLLDIEKIKKEIPKKFGTYENMFKSIREFKNNEDQKRLRNE